MEKHEEIEKQHDKRLNMILFALSIFGLTELFYRVLENESLSVFQHLLAFGIPLLIGFIFWKMVVIRKK
jgi:predicted neutral ceramidase superfamily lipid hydrolase